MRLEQLEYFKRIVETGSFSEAADTFFLSQPALSKAMGQLEDELGVTLFNRSKKGSTLTSSGDEFLTYANQILEQVNLLKRRYIEEAPIEIFNVCGQHYSFVVEAFVLLLKELDTDVYQASLRELRTYEVIEEVSELKSEIGVLYQSFYNEQVLSAELKKHQLTFHPLFKVKPHVFIYKNHPLSKKERVTFDDLSPYPRLSFEQGHFNSFYFWEETYADREVDKQIIVSDRATLFNLVIGVNGYTISSGILDDELNGKDIISVPLAAEEEIELGYITNDHHQLSPIAELFLELIKQVIQTS